MIRRYRFAPTPGLVALFAVSLPAIAPIGAGQDISPSETRTALTLERVRHDPKTQGPLLMVQGSEQPGETLVIPKQREGKWRLDEFAHALGRRVVTLDTLTVIVPDQMTVIEENPGEPNLFTDLKPHERVEVLMASLTPEQWTRIGSDDGIGANDLDRQQRPLFQSLLPEKFRVQRYRLASGDPPNTIQHEALGDELEFDTAQARLRLVREVSIEYAETGTDNYQYESPARPTAGDEILRLRSGFGLQGDRKPEPGVVIAFGRVVIHPIPARLKSGQLNFGLPALRAPVPLDDDLKTLGDLLGRIAQVTGLDLMADRRIVELPLTLRTASGQSARASDILKALCWSVTGAFRRVGRTTYLLTDDVKGIGTRLARLYDWAQAAAQQRSHALEGLTERVARNEPLRHIGFASGDPYALPPDLLKRIDAAYRQEPSASTREISPSELPEALQKAVAGQTSFWQSEGKTIRTDRIRVGTRLRIQYVLPDGLAVEPWFSHNIDNARPKGYLQSVAVPPEGARPSGPAVPSPPVQPLPVTRKRRILIARFPADTDGLNALFRQAREKGFGEVWLHVNLSEDAAPTRLKAAVAAGRKAGLAVGASVSLLRGGVNSPADVNILGETGDEFVRRLGNHPVSQTFLSGWTRPNLSEATRRLTLLARVSDLCALALKDTAAPGWAGPLKGLDGIRVGGHLGYGEDLRLTFLRAEGLDPIDVASSQFFYLYTRRSELNLPFFPIRSDDGLWETLRKFRLEENKQTLTQLYTALRQAAPDPPLYLDDRASPYDHPPTRWYGRWDDPTRIPINPVYADENEGLQAAFAAHSEALCAYYGWNGDPDALCRAFGEKAQSVPERWAGLVLDMTRLTPADTLRMLSGLPDVGRTP